MKQLLGVCALLTMTWGAGAVETAIYRDAAGNQVRYAGKFDAKPVPVPTVFVPKSTEWRGVWVATVENIDMPKCETPAEFKQEFLAILDNLQKINANAVLFQIRPANDAFYPSRLNPWSRYLTGTEGKGLGDFDPLAFMVAETHKRGMEFHAWLNPYRVANVTALSKADYLKSLSPQNFARQHPNLVLAIPKDGKRMLILDPGQPQVKRFILDTVSEIVTRYDVDAIHFDDYFYPYSGLIDEDAATFRQFNPRQQKLDDWRRANVNDIIYGIKSGLTQLNQAQKRSVELGISPFGIWANRRSHPAGSLTGGKQSYSELYADLYTWIKNGWIDYVIPQVYWNFNHDVAAYAAVTDWWSDTVTGTPVKLYIGHSVGRIGTTYDQNELAAQLRYDAVRPQIAGECLFSYKSIFRPANAAMRAGVFEVLKKYWKKPAALPKH